MNATQLRSDANRLYDDAKAKRTLAERLTYNADDYDKAGDATRAEVERTEASKLIEEATRTEEEAVKLEQGAALQEVRANELDKEQQALQADFDQRMKDIDRKKAELQGGLSLF